MLKENIEKLINHSKYFCIVPWIHLHVTGQGNMCSCCVASDVVSTTGYGNLNEYSFSELWQNKVIREFRLSLLSDKKYSSCLFCYEQERLGLNSLRKTFNKKYAKNHINWVINTDKSGFAPDAAPVNWDIRFSNLCNLSCRSCNYYASSSWFEDAKALNLWNATEDEKVISGIKDTDKFLKDMESYIPHLEGITFAGGEPLIIKENYTILEKLTSLKKYNTNLLFITNLKTIEYKNKSILSYWKKLKKLFIAVSIDGLGDKCEYIRKGIKWDKLISNFQKVKTECPNADIYIHFTLSVFNILHITDFHRMMVNEGYITADKIQLIFLHNPDFYNIKILPLEMKKLASDKITQHIEWLKKQSPFNTNKFNENDLSQWENCIEYLYEEDWNHLIPKFVNMTNRLDKLRNEDCIKVFPELKPVFEADKNIKLWMPIISSGY